MVNVEAWKAVATQLTAKMNNMADEFKLILGDWEEAHNEAGDPGKHDVDACFRALSEARAALCAVKGGSKRKHRRTRKHRR